MILEAKVKYIHVRFHFKIYLQGHSIVQMETPAYSEENEKKLILHTLKKGTFYSF